VVIEVKAAAATASDARYLTWLRDQTGDPFAARIVLHTGPHAFPVSDRIVAAPVSMAGVRRNGGRQEKRAIWRILFIASRAATL